MTEILQENALHNIVTVYNGLIVVLRHIDKSWANIDVLFKQRHDEMPKLIKVCERYVQYERETLEKITAARTACIQAKTVSESTQTEGELAKSLKTLCAVAENYPNLKANQNFTQLQQRISYLESRLLIGESYTTIRRTRTTLLESTRSQICL